MAIFINQKFKKIILNIIICVCGIIVLLVLIKLLDELGGLKDYTAKMLFINTYLMPIIFELGLWSILIGLVILIIKDFKKLNKKYIIAVIVLLAADAIIKYKFSLFFPFRNESHNWLILIPYYKNFLNGELFSAPYTYNYGSHGFIEYFFNRIFYILDSFNIFTVYYVNLILSVIKGYLIFSLSKLLFRNSAIALISLIIYIFIPVEIFLSATEIQLQFTAVTGLLLLIYLVRYTKNYKRQYLFLVFGIFLACVFGRKLYGIYSIGLLIAFGIFLIVTRDSFRKRIIKDRYLLVFIPLFFSSCLLYFFMLFAGYVGEPLFMTKINFFYLFWPPVFFNLNGGNPIPFFNSQFMPVYYYFLFIFSLIFLFLKMKNKKNYIFLFIGIIYLLLLTYCLYNNSMRQIRIALVILPFITIIVAVNIYYLLKYFNLKNNIIILLCFGIAVFPLVKNKPLYVVSGRQGEQSFLIEQIKKMPDNSLIIATRFPLYLLGNKNIVAMDLEAGINKRPWSGFPDIKTIDSGAVDKKISDQYANIYYYRNHLYKESDNTYLFGAIEDFEKNNILAIIAETQVISRNFSDIYDFYDKEFQLESLELYKVY